MVFPNDIIYIIGQNTLKIQKTQMPSEGKYPQQTLKYYARGILIKEGSKVNWDKIKVEIIISSARD